MRGWGDGADVGTTARATNGMALGIVPPAAAAGGAGVGGDGHDSGVRDARHVAVEVTGGVGRACVYDTVDDG